MCTFKFCPNFQSLIYSNIWKNKYKFGLIKRSSILVIILINYKQENQLKIMHNLNNNK